MGKAGNKVGDSIRGGAPLPKTFVHTFHLPSFVQHDLDLP